MKLTKQQIAAITNKIDLHITKLAEAAIRFNKAAVAFYETGVSPEAEKEYELAGEALLSAVQRLEKAGVKL